MSLGWRGAPMTAEDEARCVDLKDLGCLVARLTTGKWVYPEIHHLTIGGLAGQKRRGHQFTIALNPWSHRGVPFAGLSAAECREVYGPSMAREAALFRATYGDEDWLLECQNALLEAFRKATALEPRP